MSRKASCVVTGFFALTLLQSCATIDGPPGIGAVEPVLILPAADLVVTGEPLLIARQANPAIAPESVTARFEYRQTGGPWRLIRQIGYFGSATSEYYDSFNVLWETTDVASGRYAVRVGMRGSDGAPWVWSEPVGIELNKAPRVAAQASILDSAGTGVTVALSAEGTRDVDGEIAALEWAFSDGETAQGPFVTRAFRPDIEYQVTLTAVDDDGGRTSRYWFLNVSPELTFTPIGDFMEGRKECICESIDVRETGEALGPDIAAGGTTWPPNAGVDDGRKNGPLHGNPGNTAAGGEKNNTGYAFEVLATVKGDPAACTEGQNLRATYKRCRASMTEAICNVFNGTWEAANNCCTHGTPWTGTVADLDKDGDNDIEVDTRAKCEAEGGRWNAAQGNCFLTFKKADAGYKPDTMSGGGSLYDAPHAFRKAHDGNRILFFDTPSIGLGYVNGSSADIEFITYVRGTDGKYCYAKSNVTYERKAGDDDEDINVTEERTGRDSIPGG